MKALHLQCATHAVALLPSGLPTPPACPAMATLPGPQPLPWRLPLLPGWLPQAEAGLPVQERLYRSLKLWSFYVDLEESLGTLESTKAVYESMLDLKVATAQVVLNYASFLQEGKYWEDSFRWAGERLGGWGGGVDFSRWGSVDGLGSWLPSGGGGWGGGLLQVGVGGWVGVWTSSGGGRGALPGRGLARRVGEGPQGIGGLNKRILGYSFRWGLGLGREAWGHKGSGAAGVQVRSHLG